jgi:three-Cys-motif partner protein
VSGKQLSLFEQQPEDSGDFFTRKRSWSASKHRIMLKYIQSFCYNLGGDQPYQSKYLNYVDGFAGTGKYDQGIGIENFVGNSNFLKKYSNDFSDTDGSPIIALKWAKIFSQENRVNLRCFFNEANKKVNEKLKINCQSLINELFCKIYEPKKFALCLPELMNDLENYPTLFFLDTFGVKGVTFEQICLIANYVSQYKGELFLLFHNIQVARHAGQSTARSEDPQKLKAAQTYTQNLTALLGPNSELDWKPKWLELNNLPQHFERWALEYFKSRLLKESSFRGVGSFKIREDYNDRRPQYSLVVCSNKPEKAFGEFLNEFFWEEDKLLYFKDNQSKTAQEFLEREWNHETNERIIKVKPIIINLLREHLINWMPVNEVITLLILKMGDLGYLKRTQYREILLKIHQEGILEARNLGTKGKVILESQIRIVK